MELYIPLMNQGKQRIYEPSVTFVAVFVLIACSFPSPLLELFFMTAPSPAQMICFCQIDIYIYTTKVSFWSSEQD